MNPFLMSLLGQSAGSQIGPNFLDDMERRDANGDLIGNEIIVPATPRPAPQDEPLPLTAETVKPSPLQINLKQQDVADDFIMGNAKPVAMAREAQRDTALNSDRRGMFGVKGTLRDILGLVGDAFLVQSGNPAVYMNRNREDQWADAMAGFSGGPEAERMAIERGMRIDPTRTQEFLKQSQLNRSNMGNLALRGQELGRDENNDLRKRLTGLAATAVTSNNPEVRAQALRIIQANTAGLPEDDVLRSGDLALIAGSGATPNQMLTLPLAERRVEATEANVNIAKERLQQGWANVKTNQGRLALAREIFGQNVSEEEFNQQMELLELPYRIGETVSRTERNNRSNRGDNSSSNKENRSWTIRPAGK